MTNRIRTDTGQMEGPIAFFGADVVSQQAAMTAAVADAPSGNSTSGFSSSGDKNTAVACINRNKTRIGEIETFLKNMGFIPA